MGNKGSKEKFIASTRCASTPLEGWTLERPLSRRKTYAIAADFAVEYLGSGNGRNCLVIGSPIYEASLLGAHGWDVTFMDVRDPPRHQISKFIQSDASKMPLSSDSFDAISTTCVLSHIGLGRYGDPLTGSDELAMGEMHRVLKPSGKAAVTFGNVTDGDETIRIGTCHRIYTAKSARLLAAQFEIEKESVWNSGDTLEENEYISMGLKKHA
jgi:SAM-dependent methyltransferase